MQTEKRFRLLNILIVGMLVMSSLAFTGAGASTDGVLEPMVGDLPPLNKTFYLHTVDTAVHIGSLTTLNTMNTTRGANFQEISSAMRIVAKWHIFPVLAGPVVLTGDVNLTLNMKASALDTPAEWIIQVREVSNDGDYVGTIAYEDVPDITLTTTYQEVNIVTSVIGGNYTVNASSSIEVFLQMKGNAARTYYAAWGNETYDSRVILECRDYLYVDDIWAEDWNGTVKAGFMQNEANKSISIKADITDPFGGYDIHWAKISVEYPNGTWYENSTMTFEEGYFNSYHSIYRWDWNYSGKPAGRYNVTVTALDNTGYYYNLTNPGYGGHLISNDSFFFTIGSAFDVNIRLFDSKGLTLNYTEFIVTVGGGALIVNTTNNTGMSNISVAGGIYNFYVVWQDVLVPVTNESGSTDIEITGNVSQNEAINLTAGIYYKTFKMLDSRNESLSDAAVYVTHPNGTTTIIPYKTDKNGTIELYRTASGNYQLSVIWLGVEVYNNVITINDNQEQDLLCNVFYMTVYAHDSDGIGLENTQVVIYDNETGIVRDSKLTNASGGLESRLPNGVYDIVVYWQGTIVGENYTESLLSDMLVVVDCSVFQINITLLDDWNISLSEAKVSIISGDNGKVISGGITDEKGNVSLRVPIGNHTIQAYWQDVLVYFDVITFNGTDITLNVGVYYLWLKVQDARGIGVENAHISIRHNSTGRTLENNITDIDGRILSRLPGCMLDISVTWQDIIVNHTYYNLEKSTNATINAAIYYVTFRIVDTNTSTGSPVENARVTIKSASTGRTLDSNTTNSTGEIVARLPAGDVEIAVWWQEVEVARETRKIDKSVSDTTIQVDTEIYYLTIEVLDAKNISIKGAQVLFKYQSSGRILASEFTDDNGICRARLPYGLIELTVTWRDVVVNSTVHNLTSNHLLIVGAEVYYLEISVVDSRGLPVSDADVRIMLTANGNVVDTNLTDATGILNFRLPKETFDISIEWLDVEIYNRTIILDTNIDITAQTRIYYLELTFVDSRQIPVEDADVTISTTASHRLLWALTTDSEGFIEARVPATEIHIGLLWQDANIGDYILNVDDNISGTYNVMIGYVSFELVDSDGLAVAQAEIVVRHATTERIQGTGITDSEGIITFRLPKESVEITAIWDSVEVMQEIVELDGTDDSITLHPGVFYAELRVIDSQAMPIEGVMVSFTNSISGRLHRTLLTDENGTLVARLPNGNFDIVALWKDTLIYNENSVGLFGDLTKELNSTVYYWSLEVNDVESRPLEGAELVLTVAETGSMIWDGYTSTTGKASLRLPARSYDLKVAWKGTDVYEEKNITLNEDNSTLISAAVYYLTVSVKGNDAQGVMNTIITVYKGNERIDSGITDETGSATFRLPTGTYTIEAIYRGNYLLTPIILDIDQTADLVTGNHELNLEVKEYPPPVYKTNLFYLLALSMLLTGALLFMLLKQRGKEQAEMVPEETEIKTLEEEVGN